MEKGGGGGRIGEKGGTAINKVTLWPKLQSKSRLGQLCAHGREKTRLMGCKGEKIANNSVKKYGEKLSEGWMTG